MSIVYKLIVYQTITVPVDVLGKPVSGLPGIGSTIEHCVAKEYYDTNQKALDRQAYYTSTYPAATFVFKIESQGVA